MGKVMNTTSRAARSTGRLAPFACAVGLALSFSGTGAARDVGSARYAALPSSVAPATLEAQAAPTPAGQGAVVYAQDCASCHQADGRGVPGAFPPLANDKLVQGDARYLARVVLYGLQGQVTVNGQTFNGALPGFAPSLSDEQIGQALNYIRGAWGNHAAAVGAAVVKAERAKPGTPRDNYEKYPK